MRRRPSGYTIIELLVYAMLLLMLMEGVYAVFVATMRGTRVAAATNNLQSAAQASLAEMFNELSQSSGILGAVACYKAGIPMQNTDPSQDNYTVNTDLIGVTPTYSGVVFVSAVAGQGYVSPLTSLNNHVVIPSTFDQDSEGTTNPGAPVWHKWICYYYIPPGTNPLPPGNASGNTIYRKETVDFGSDASLTPPTTDVPIIDDVVNNGVLNKLVATDVTQFLTKAFNSSVAYTDVNISTSASGIQTFRSGNVVQINVLFSESVNSQADGSNDNTVHVVDYVVTRGDT